MVIPFQSPEHQTDQRLQIVRSSSDETCLDKLPGMSGYSLNTGTKKKTRNRIITFFISYIIQFSSADL